MSAPAESKPQLLFFYSARSGSSRRAEAFIAQVLQRRRNHDTFVLRRIEVDEHPEIAERFRVTETPTVFVVDQNRVSAQLVKPRGCTELEALMRPWLH